MRKVTPDLFYLNYIQEPQPVDIDLLQDKVKMQWLSVIKQVIVLLLFLSQQQIDLDFELIKAHSQQQLAMNLGCFLPFHL